MEHVKTDHASTDQSAANIAEYARQVNESSFHEKFDCELCDRTFENEKDLADHKIIHQEVIYDKTRAKHNFSNIQTDEWGNIIDSDSEEEYEPQDTTVASSENEDESEDEVDDEIFKCTKCPSKFRLEMSLENHLQKVHCGDFKCKLCTWRFIDEHTLKNHEGIGHSAHEWRKLNKKVSPEEDITVSQERIVTEFEAVDETEVFGNENPKCTICKKVFQQKSNLSRHMKNQHESESETSTSKKRKSDQNKESQQSKKVKTSHTCMDCGKQCRDNYNLLRHLKSHKK